MRIVSWNVENLAPSLNGAAPSLPEIHARVGCPAALCLQEVRIRAHDAVLLARLRTALPGYDCHCSLNRDAKNAAHRGGRAYGVVTFIDAALCAQPRTFDFDREGRVVASVIDSMKLALFNVYAVNGTAKPYRDPQTGAVDGDRHAFKRRFIEQLGVEASALQRAGLELVLIGDWNVSRTRLDTFPRLRTEPPHALARAEFNDAFMPRLGLVDAFRALHPDARRYTWFNRRARGGRLDAARVDFALVSAGLAPRVSDAGIDETRAARMRSDHAPLWITLD